LSNKASLVVQANQVTTERSTKTAGLTLSQVTASAKEPKTQFTNTGLSAPSTNSATVSEPKLVEL